MSVLLSTAVNCIALFFAVKELQETTVLYRMCKSDNEVYGLGEENVESLRHCPHFGTLSKNG